MTYPINVLIKNIMNSYKTTDWKITLLEQWIEIMGPLSTHLTPEKIEDDTITLTVNDSCWLQEFYTLSPLLLQKINATLDQKRIKQVRFKLKTFKKKHRIPTSVTVRQEGAPALRYTMDTIEKKALTEVTDAHLQEALETFYMRCRKEME